MSNSDLLLEVFAFDCGHGDTILVRLPDSRWVLVDCYLPKQGGVRDRFFKFLKQYEIRTLAVVFQTHPDFDHFNGMREVLEYFVNTPGHSVGRYFDSGLNPDQIHRFQKNGGIGRDIYKTLLESLREWDDAGKLQWIDMDSERKAFRPKGNHDIMFMPVAPGAKQKRRLIEMELKKNAGKPKPVFERNPLSLVLVLSVKSTQFTLNALLAADAEVPDLKRGIGIWSSFAGKDSRPKKFDIIKVPHHGSIRNHEGSFTKLGNSNRRVALICAGQRDALPDRTVIQSYQTGGWDVHCTTIRRAQRTRNTPSQLHFRTTPSIVTSGHTVHFQAFQDGFIKVSPDDSRVDPQDLTHYGTKGK